MDDDARASASARATRRDAKPAATRRSYAGVNNVTERRWLVGSLLWSYEMVASHD